MSVKKDEEFIKHINGLLAHVAGLGDWGIGRGFAKPEDYRLTVEKRKEVVKVLTDQGLSQRNVAKALGVDKKTVLRDLGKGKSKAGPNAPIDVGKDQGNQSKAGPNAPIDASTPGQRALEAVLANPSSTNQQLAKATGLSTASIAQAKKVVTDPELVDDVRQGMSLNSAFRIAQDEEKRQLAGLPPVQPPKPQEVPPEQMSELIQASCFNALLASFKALNDFPTHCDYKHLLGADLLKVRTSVKKIIKFWIEIEKSLDELQQLQEEKNVSL
jgi:hypothetical protein